MKKLFAILVLALCACAAQGQTFKTYSCTASGCTPNNNATGLYVQNANNVSYTLTWTVTGSPTCAVTVDSSVNGLSWTTGGIIPSQNCGSTGNTASTDTANWVRVMPTISGSGTVSFTLQGVPFGHGGAISSVSNSDGTLAISPTTGSVVASLQLAHSNVWTAAQTINPTGTAFSLLPSNANFVIGNSGTGSRLANLSFC